jgi:hypothetical protein
MNEAFFICLRFFAVWLICSFTIVLHERKKSSLPFTNNSLECTCAGLLFTISLI